MHMSQWQKVVQKNGTMHSKFLNLIKEQMVTYQKKKKEQQQNVEKTTEWDQIC